MSIRGRRPAPKPASTPPMSQDIQRHRRRHWLKVHYTDSFDLTVEITAILSPLAVEIDALPHPLAMRNDIDTLADAVHELLSVVIGMLAESKHLDGAARARTNSAIADLAQRPREPAITDSQIAAGTWATVLINHVCPYSNDLATFLGRAVPPRTMGLTGPSASERLEAALRVLDAAALPTQRRIPRVAARQELGTVAQANAAARARRDAERAQQVLTRIGGGAPATTPLIP